MEDNKLLQKFAATLIKKGILYQFIPYCPQACAGLPDFNILQTNTVIAISEYLKLNQWMNMEMSIASFKDSQIKPARLIEESVTSPETIENDVREARAVDSDKIASKTQELTEDCNKTLDSIEEEYEKKMLIKNTIKYSLGASAVTGMLILASKVLKDESSLGIIKEIFNSRVTKQVVKQSVERANNEDQSLLFKLFKTIADHLKK